MYGGFPSGSDGKESAFNVGDLCSIPGAGSTCACVWCFNV